LIAKEFAKTAEDILWRRTKLGLYLSAEQQVKVTEYIDAKVQKEVPLKFSLAG